MNTKIPQGLLQAHLRQNSVKRSPKMLFSARSVDLHQIGVHTTASI
jgi:hypothetical protein